MNITLIKTYARSSHNQSYISQFRAKNVAIMEIIWHGYNSNYLGVMKANKH
jgi:hypothetical protein